MSAAVRQTTIRLDEWRGLEFPAVMVTDDDGHDHLYIPLRVMVIALFGDEQSVNAQRKRVKRDTLLDTHSAHFTVRTDTRGDQDMLCLESVAIGRWINGLEVERIRPELRQRILEFQYKLMIMADRVLRGEVDGNPLILLKQTRALQERRPSRLALEADLKKFMTGVMTVIGDLDLDVHRIRDLLETSEYVAPDGAYCCPICGHQGDRDEFAV